MKTEIKKLILHVQETIVLNKLKGKKTILHRLNDESQQRYYDILMVEVTSMSNKYIYGIKWHTREVDHYIRTGQNITGSKFVTPIHKLRNLKIGTDDDIYTYFEKFYPK